MSEASTGGSSDILFTTFHMITIPEASTGSSSDILFTTVNMITMHKASTSSSSDILFTMLHMAINVKISNSATKGPRHQQFLWFFYVDTTYKISRSQHIIFLNFPATESALARWAFRAMDRPTQYVHSASLKLKA